LLGKVQDYQVFCLHQSCKSESTGKAVAERFAKAFGDEGEVFSSLAHWATGSRR
jgi:hypothetical protein